MAARLAAEVQADLLILMSDVDGIYTCPPSEEGARLINTYSPDHAINIQYGKKSRVGLGGMDSKVLTFYLIKVPFQFLTDGLLLNIGSLSLLGIGEGHLCGHLQWDG